MLEKAEETPWYDELVEAELTEFLGRRLGAYQLITSSDTLNYFGRLDSVFKAAHAALVGGGYLIFTVEHLEGSSDTPFKLHGHGRYSHTGTHMRGELESAGFAIEAIQHDVLRNEGDDPVAGLVITARKPTGAPINGLV